MQHLRLDGPPEMWWLANSTAVAEHLRRDGAVVIDGDGLCQDIAAFQRLAAAACGPLAKDNPEHNSIDDDPTGTINSPTPFSRTRKLLWHNENTFARRWPRRIIFGCQEIGDGGQTPTADMTTVYERLSSSARDVLATGVTYVRRLGMDLGLDWRQVYGTTDPTAVERACEREGATWRWDERGGILTTEQRRPAVILDPATGRPSLTAQILHWHPRALDEEIYDSLRLLYEPHEFPKGCRRGDGGPIPDAVIDELVEICSDLEEVVPWKPDRTIVVDNLRRSHARNPYTGVRRLLVAVGDLVDCAELARP